MHFFFFLLYGFRIQRNTKSGVKLAVVINLTVVTRRNWINMQRWTWLLVSGVKCTLQHRGKYISLPVPSQTCQLVCRWLSKQLAQYFQTIALGFLPPWQDTGLNFLNNVFLGRVVMFCWLYRAKAWNELRRKQIDLLRKYRTDLSWSCIIFACVDHPDSPGICAAEVCESWLLCPRRLNQEHAAQHTSCNPCVQYVGVVHWSGRHEQRSWWRIRPPRPAGKGVERCKRQTWV